MVSFATLLTFVSGAAALGINCRGSGGCTFNNASLREVLTQVQQIQAQGNGGHHYGTGVQLACSSGQYCKSCPNAASVCAFYQNGASGTADRAAQLLQGLIDHGCSQCGSNPTEPGNDVSKGELTVNIVSGPCCSGNCHCPI